ncbi:MAG: AMP-dependent synthetase and ligase, partial [Pseudonocardia sp.]|nr:AMP-dependent synthetase and ligase [Pseudonocardia sp.]
MYRTIPRLLLDAADRDPDGAWLRSDDGEWSFAQAAGWVGASMQRLRDAGLAHGDLVVLTARSTPAYLISWFAVTALGAIAVPTNPRGTWAELSGLLRQTRPRLVVTDDGLRELVAEAGVAAIPGLDVLHVNDVVTDEQGVRGDNGSFTP